MTTTMLTTVEAMTRRMAASVAVMVLVVVIGVLATAGVAAAAPADNEEIEGGTGTGQQAPLTIINGSDVVMASGQDGFLYCFSGGVGWGGGRWWSGGRRGGGGLGHLGEVTLVWTDPHGHVVPRYNSGARVWATEEREVDTPHSFLVVRGFGSSLAGRYTCSLRAGHRVLASTSVNLWLFRPTFRVLGLPRCVVGVRRGATLLLPSPVVGTPPSPPLWRRLGGGGGRGGAEGGGHLDPSRARQLPGGLLLVQVKGESVSPR
ncbi:hypothetical protein Pmani_029786 [Petrolisthes manimaculis]|uniref:Ig-like domain-containing protein n=1 Tax=Petrolisthes manimaculis TaxID=1843537 RepID=A0AAE1NYM8_9EUCA|nr:hypothetical protein Pmani_029786 [Petrolisthes manimaculis]